MTSSPLLTFFLLGAAVQFFALCLVNRRTAVTVFCALLPTYLFRLSLPVPFLDAAMPTTLLEVMLLSLFFVWLFMDGPRTINRAALDRWLGPATLLILGATAGMLISPDLRAAAGVWRAYFVEPMLFFVVFTSVVRGAAERRNVLAALGASMAVIGVSAVFQKFTGFGIPNPIWQAEATRRVTSFYGFPNAIGLFAAPTVVLMAGWTTALALQKGRQKLLAILPAIAALLGLLGIFFAVSEGAMIGVLAGLLVLGLLAKPLRPAALILLIAASMVTSAYKPVRDYASVLLSLRDDSGMVRKIVWQESLDMLYDHPVFGAGLAGYRPILEPYHAARHIEIFMYPHDLFLNFWSETGIIGLLGFLWLLAAFFRDNGRLLKRGRNGLLPISLIAAMSAIVVHGLVDVPYFKNDLALLFWILAGLTASMTTETPSKTAAEKLKAVADQFHLYLKGE
jgi:putative inorganic carbon (HCO3(-)) transporter